MKEVQLPIVSERISISSIESTYNGILICYKNGNCVGYIIMGDNDRWEDTGSWLYCNTIDPADNIYEGDSLYELLEELLTEQIIDTCKTLDFYEEVE